jgi:beta-lactamase regulating signal transducer with metallopeptidase domain
MTAAIVVYILLVTLPLIGAAIFAEKACRLWALPVRGVWAMTALVMVLIGGRALVNQHATTQPISITLVNGVQLQHHTAPDMITRVELAATTLVALPRTAASYVANIVGSTQSGMLAIAWCLMSAAVLVVICLVYVRLWRLRRTWNVAEFAGHSVRVSPYAGPAVIGILHPEIIVPGWVLESRSEDADLIVLHETEHRNAHDQLLLAGMWALVALFPWHPGSWYCLARTRLAIELDCDARVVGRGTSLRAYAQLLLNQARAQRGAPLHFWLGATSLLEPVSHLERRLDAMTLPSITLAQNKTVRYLRTLSYAAIVATVAVAACESHVPTAADITGLDAASAEKNARSASLISQQPVAYYVDGVSVSADQAHAVHADSIRTVTVLRSGKATEKQQIRITTVNSRNAADSTGMASLLANGQEVATRILAPPESDAGHLATVSQDKTTPPLKVAITIDGVKSDAAAMRALNPADIASVEVIKGPAALKESTDPLAKNGIVRITLKH